MEIRTRIGEIKEPYLSYQKELKEYWKQTIINNNYFIVNAIEAKISECTKEINSTDNPLTAERLSNKRAGLYEALFSVQDNTLDAIRKYSEAWNSALESEVENG